MNPESQDRIAKLHRLLIEEADPRDRAEIHVALGKIAVDEGKLSLAIRHYREALLQDPSAHTARDALRSLGEASLAAVQDSGERGRKTIRRVLERFARTE
jgi:tetratricopeptide (TPR) repeat protein